MSQLIFLPKKKLHLDLVCVPSYWATSTFVNPDSIKGSVMPTYRLDSVANAKDELVLLSHAIDELHGNEASVIGTGELSCRTIQSPSKPVTLWEGVKYG